MHRFIIEPGLGVGDIAALDPSEANHALRVLRLKPGVRIQLCDGQGALFWAELLEGADARARITEACDSTEASTHLTLYQGLPKFDKLELIAQKATELGVSRIVPVKMARCVVKLDAREGEKRRERIAKICQEAAKQSGRARVPEVLAPVSVEQAARMIADEQVCALAWEEARGLGLSGLNMLHPVAHRIGIVIGPEGGIAPEEAQALTAAGATPVTLGPRILRTETAAIACCALAMSLWGDLG